MQLNFFFSLKHDMNVSLPIQELQGHTQSNIIWEGCHAMSTR